jgi:D-alanine-D-alanine ligase
MKREFKRVAVLMGGISEEREVSLRSGAAVARGLRAAGYTVDEVDVRSSELDLPEGTDAVFLALHGRFGEDGTVQVLLRERGIPYTGCDPEASRVAFDKTLTRQRLREAGVAVPPGLSLTRASERSPLPCPLVVKPACQGSSVGCHFVFDPSEWGGAIEDALRYGGEAVVETYIPGAELTVGFVGDDALPVIEICAPQGRYDTRAKYTAGLTEYRVPVPRPAAELDRIRDLAARAYRALGGRGMGRVDLRMTPDGDLYVLELNTLPGFTETSLLPKAAAAAGLSFPALCDRILQLAEL